MQHKVDYFHNIIKMLVQNKLNTKCYFMPVTFEAQFIFIQKKCYFSYAICNWLLHHIIKAVIKIILNDECFYFYWYSYINNILNKKIYLSKQNPVHFSIFATENVILFVLFNAVNFYLLMCL